MDRGVKMYGWSDLGRSLGATASSVTGRVRAMFTRNDSSWAGVYRGSRVNYRTAAGDPRDNSAFMAVVNWIARNAPDAPLTLSREFPDGHSDKIFPSELSPGRFLRLWENPNRYWSGPLMQMALYTDVYCGGNGYLIKLRGQDDRVRELWWTPSTLIAPWWRPGSNDYITAYRQVVDGQEIFWPVDDVIHVRLGIDPDNPRLGMSPARSLLREIFTDNEAAAFTAALLGNLAVPGVIIAPANTVGASIRGKANVIKDQFKQTFGGDSRGEPMVLTAPTEVKVLSFTPEQMQMRELRKIPEERISAVLGVAAIVAGLGAGLDRSTFSNFGEARRAAYTESIMTLHRLVASTLETQALSDFPDTQGTDESALEIAFDWTKAAAMAEAAGDIHKRSLDALRAGAIMRSQYLRETGRPWTDDDDVYAVANNMIFVPKTKAALPFEKLVAPDPVPTPRPAGPPARED